MKYEETDVQVTRLYDHIKKKPEIYWGKKSPKLNDCIEVIESQIKEDGGSPAQTTQHKSWTIVWSHTPWIDALLGQHVTISDVFNKVIQVGESKQSLPRAEFLVATVADRLVAWRSGECTAIRGALDESLVESLQLRLPDCTAVCFIV